MYSMNIRKWKHKKLVLSGLLSAFLIFPVCNKTPDAENIYAEIPKPKFKIDPEGIVSIGSKIDLQLMDSEHKGNSRELGKYISGTYDIESIIKRNESFYWIWMQKESALKIEPPENAKFLVIKINVNYANLKKANPSMQDFIIAMFSVKSNLIDYIRLSNNELKNWKIDRYKYEKYIVNGFLVLTLVSNADFVPKIIGENMDKRQLSYMILGVDFQ